jgi:hypothetical protein
MPAAKIKTPSKAPTTNFLTLPQQEHPEEQQPSFFSSVIVSPYDF